MNKKIVFLTGTRADFGKLKSIMRIVQEKNDFFDLHVFVTGMHMNSKYGGTVEEIEKSGFLNIYKFINHDRIDNMDRILGKTIEGFSLYVQELKPDMIVVHGDRVEALAGAIVGALNNILVAHIEGGEVSGTIDESIRHSITKLSHIHFVANKVAKSRVYKLGEDKNSIFTIGSPDIDIMFSKDLPDLTSAKSRYEIDFEDYIVLMYHPVTTEHNEISNNIKSLVDAVLDSNENYIAIYPNNDFGSDIIINEFERLKNNSKIKIYPSLRFEYFLTLLKNAKCIIGNSSAGIREAPLYGVPTINIGSRQNGRSYSDSIIHTNDSKDQIIEAIQRLRNNSLKFEKIEDFGSGNSAKLFLKIVQNKDFWNIKIQKVLNEIY